MRLYTVRLNVSSMSDASVSANRLTFADFRRAFEQQFCVQLNSSVAKQVKALAKSHAATPMVVKGGRVRSDREEEAVGGGSGRRGAAEDVDAVTAAQRSKHAEHLSYDGPDDDEKAAIEAEEIAAADSDSEDEIDAATREAKLAAKAAAKRARPRSGTDADAEMDPAAAAAADAGEEDDDDEPQSNFNVLQKCSWIYKVNYSDGRTAKHADSSFAAAAQSQTWLECIVAVPLSIPKLLMMSFVERLVGDVLLRATPKIAKSFVVEKLKVGGAVGEKEIIVQTDGVNFRELYRHQDMFDCNRISSNDIAAILRTYGVEAARAAIVREVTAVFKVYGISIDNRHLGLVADYMTFHGGFRPLNRAGIDSNPSPFQKISFETSIGFLMNACMFNDRDFMSSPSSR